MVVSSRYSWVLCYASIIFEMFYHVLAIALGSRIGIQTFHEARQHQLAAYVGFGACAIIGAGSKAGPHFSTPLFYAWALYFWNLAS